MNIHDTIAAVSTPPGRGGIGIVRISGTNARAIARKHPAVSGAGPTWKAWSAALAELPDADGHTVDQVVVDLFRSAALLYCRRCDRDCVPWLPGGPALCPGACLRGGRAPGRTWRIHAAGISERPHRSAASGGGARSDRRHYALPGANRGAASRRVSFAAFETGERAAAGVDRAAGSRYRFRRG